MKFAHLADMHIGSWKEPKLRDLSTKAFEQTVARCIAFGVDFVIISGDLFNTSLPAIECIKTAVVELKKFKEKNIPVYTIAGSHDFSPSGKTMLDVLEEADLVINVCKGEVVDGKLVLDFTTDKKTGAKITGMIGKKGMLEKKYYEELSTEKLEKETGFKIFLFHTAIAELKPEEMEKMEAAPISLLPKGFDYYAGGHVHIVKETALEGYKHVVYPGPTFPNSFAELEKLENGGFYIYDNGAIKYEPIKTVGVKKININCEHKLPESVNSELIEATNIDVKNSIVLVRISGMLENGKTTDVNTSKMFETLQSNGAYFVMKNTNKLSTKQFEERKIQADNAEDAEKLLIAEHTGQIKTLNLSPDLEKDLVEKLMNVLDVEKDEGQKTADHEARIISEMDKIFNK